MFQIKITQKAKKALNKLPDKIQLKIVEQVDKLHLNPRPKTAKKLTNQEGYRIRVSEWRLLYITDKKRKIITIVRIAHRREVYR